MDIENTIQELQQRADFLRQTIEQNDLWRQKYDIFIDILRAVSELLSRYPIDTKKLAGETLGIIKILGGPLHNQLEEDLVEFAGDIGLLIRRLKQEPKL